MADDLSILQEIDESLRADRLEAFWQRFGNLVIAVCAGIVLLTIASVVWKNRQHTLHMHETALLLQAQMLAQNSKQDEALHLLDEAQKGSSSLAALAMLREAAFSLTSQQTDKALMLYSKTGKQYHGNVDETLPDFAILQQSSIEDNDHKPIDLADAGATGHPFAYSINEIQAARFLNEGKNQEAKNLLAPIAGDVKAPASQRARAMEMLDSIEGQTP